MNVDSLVVTLGLDPRNFTQGQKDAMEQFKKFQEQAAKGAKDQEQQAKRTMESLGGLKTQALELFSILAGGKGVINFVTGLTQADAAVGRVSRSTGASVSQISKWQSAARLLGGDAETMANSFIKMNDAFEGFRHGFGDPAMLARLAGLSRAGGTAIDITKGPEEVFLAMAENLKHIADTQGAGAAGAIGRQFGLDPALLDMLLKGRDVTKQILDHVKAIGGATEASADAAGELARRWNSIFLRTDEAGRQTGLIPDILGAADFLNMTPSEAWAYLNRTDRMKNGLATRPKSSVPGFNAAPTGAFTSQTEKEAFIRSEAVKRGINPDAAMAVARSEGFDSFISKIPGEQSFGAFQLHVTPGGKGNAIGDQFQKKTGLDPSDRANERAGIVFALDDIKAHGWHDYHGAANGAHLQNWEGIDRNAPSTVTTNIENVTINAGPNASATDIANKLRDLGLKRQAQASQSAVGGS